MPLIFELECRYSVLLLNTVFSLYQAVVFKHSTLPYVQLQTLYTLYTFQLEFKSVAGPFMLLEYVSTYALRHYQYYSRGMAHA